MEHVSILLLEDSCLDAELVQENLRAGGVPFTARRASMRQEFFDALDRGPYEVILADYNLPDFNGLSALEIGKAVAPRTPIIFVSGMLGEEIAVEALKRGATDYVLKQRLSRLVPAIRRA